MKGNIPFTWLIHWVNLERVRLCHFLLTLHHFCLTVSWYTNTYAASCYFYLNHSHNQENGEGNESGFHVYAFWKISCLKIQIYLEFCRGQFSWVQASYKAIILFMYCEMEELDGEKIFFFSDKNGFFQLQRRKYSSKLSCRLILSLKRPLDDSWWMMDDSQSTNAGPRDRKDNKKTIFTSFSKRARPSNSRKAPHVSNNLLQAPPPYFRQTMISIILA